MSNFLKCMVTHYYNHRVASHILYGCICMRNTEYMSADLITVEESFFEDKDSNEYQAVNKILGKQ